MPETMVSVEVPESAVAAVTEFLDKRSAKKDAGFCFGVKLPAFDGISTWAVFTIEDSEWTIMRPVDAK